MFNFYKRPGSPYYQVRIKGSRYSTGRTTIREAREWARRKLDEIENPRRVAAERAQLVDVLADYIDTRKAIGRSPATIEFYEKRARAILRQLGPGILVSQLSARGVLDFIEAREAKVKRKTVKMELTLLHAALALAYAQQIAPIHPDALIPKGYSADYRPRERFLTWCEAGQLLEQLSAHRRAHVAFTLATGARAEEALRAQPKDVMMAEGVVWMRGTKTKRSAGYVPILEPLRWMLELALPEMPFRPWSPTNASRDLRIACRRAGVEPVTRRDLRRTPAQWLRELGVSPRRIAEFLRNSEEVAREVYAPMNGVRLGRTIASVFKPH